MNDFRPTPEQMLERARLERDVEGSHRARGRLKLFFGYAAGVGKTYAMLQAARLQAAEGKEVVVGYVEPHGRKETEALLEGLEQLPTQELTYRGAKLREFDLDGALVRRPELILVDELAHSNTEGARHVKRWQDVEELLAAGVDVYSTMNVQHIESLNDVVAQISGVVVRETVPDHMVRSANEVVLVDLPPEELLARLREGKVYLPQQAARALDSFFRRENLVALREIAMRQAAERLHDDVEAARVASAATAPWPTAERLLVCVGPSPTSAKVVRAAKRFADRWSAPWVAVYVHPTGGANARDAENAHANLILAESLGAETARVAGDNVAAAVVEFAQRRNVTKIVVGKPVVAQSMWRRNRTFVDRLIQDSGEVDVLVVRGVENALTPSSPIAKRVTSVTQWTIAAAALLLASLVGTVFHRIGFTEANIVMTYLLAVVFCGVRLGRGPAVVAALASVGLFDVLFTEPYYQVTVYDSQYLVTFVVMLVVGVTASTLTTTVRQQMEVARTNERRTEALYRLANRLGGAAVPKDVVAEAESAIGDVFDGYAVVFLPNSQGRIVPVYDHLHLFAASASEFAAAQWVFDYNQPAGAGTDTLPMSQALYLPLSTPSRVVGVLALQFDGDREPLSIEERQLLAAFASHVAFALERAKLTQEAEHAKVVAETEKLRTSLLSAVSHDLRTPLAGIAGASSTLAESFSTLDPTTRRDLLQSIHSESGRLSRLVENLLHMTRLTGDRVQIERQWHPVDEVVGSALTRMEARLHGRPIQVRLYENLPLISIDAMLVEQLLVNLIENADKYSPPDGPIEIEGHVAPGGVELAVLDRGRGFTPGEEQHVFDLFFRGGEVPHDRAGSGIGLAICHAVAEVHGGRITAANRPGGGAVVTVRLPNAGTPPVIEDISAEAIEA